MITKGRQLPLNKRLHSKKHGRTLGIIGSTYNNIDRMDYHFRWLLEAIKRCGKCNIHEATAGTSSMGQGDVLFYSA